DMKSAAFMLCLLFALGSAAALAPQRTATLSPDAAKALFSSKVRPVLEAHCVKCHGGEATKGEFDLTTRQGLLHGGGDGPAVLLFSAAAKSAAACGQRRGLVSHADRSLHPREA